MAEHNELGKSGETAAMEYLQGKGYIILETNWRRGKLELDIIAKTDDELVFVEVKTRSIHSLTDPEAAVDKAKIRNIVMAADIYIKMTSIDLPARFDIISVISHEFGFDIDHIEDAFYPPLNTYK